MMASSIHRGRRRGGGGRREHPVHPQRELRLATPFHGVLVTEAKPGVGAAAPGFAPHTNAHTRRPTRDSPTWEWRPWPFIPSEIPSFRVLRSTARPDHAEVGLPTQPKEEPTWRWDEPPGGRACGAETSATGCVE